MLGKKLYKDMTRQERREFHQAYNPDWEPKHREKLLAKAQYDPFMSKLKRKNGADFWNNIVDQKAELF